MADNPKPHAFLLAEEIKQGRSFVYANKCVDVRKFAVRLLSDLEALRRENEQLQAVLKTSQDELDAQAQSLEALSSRCVSLEDQNAELREDKKRIDKLQAVFEEYQYQQDITLQSDEEDGVWFARFYRHDQGEIHGLSLDPTDSKTETVRAAIDAINFKFDAAMSQAGTEEPKGCHWHPISEIHEEFWTVVLINVDDCGYMELGSNLDPDWNESKWTHFAKIPVIRIEDYKRMVAEAEKAKTAKGE